MMIRNQDEFDNALSQLADYLASPPPAGTGEDRSFLDLMHAVEAYQPAMPTEPESDVDEARVWRAGVLLDKARELAERLKAEQHGATRLTYPQDGQGIGPTTGATH